MMFCQYFGPEYGYTCLECFLASSLIDLGCDVWVVSLSNGRLFDVELKISTCNDDYPVNDRYVRFKVDKCFISGWLLASVDNDRPLLEWQRRVSDMIDVDIRDPAVDLIDLVWWFFLAGLFIRVK